MVIAAPRSLKLTIGKYVWGWMGWGEVGVGVGVR